MAYASWHGQAQFGTLKVLKSTPKMPNGTLHVLSGTQLLSPTLMQFHAILHSRVIF